MEYRISDELEAHDIESAVIESLHNHANETSGAQSKKKQTLPEMYIFPITRKPFFPGMAAPLVIEPGPYYEALKAISKTDNKLIGIVLTKDENADIHNIDIEDLFHIGVSARILRIIPMEQGGAQIILNMENRIEIITPKKSKKSQKEKKEPKQLYAKVRFHRDSIKQTEEIKAYATAIISTIKELLKLNPLFKEELQIFLSHSDFTEPGKLADFSAALTTASRADLQDVLETLDIPNRVNKALTLLKNELDLSQLQNTIQQKIESTINKAQKEFYLREQLKTIKKELGADKDDTSSDQDKFKQRIEGKKLSDELKKTIQEELEKLSNLEPQSPEYGLSRNYLDWLTSLPWGYNSPDINSLKTAKTILEQGHYGLKDLKKRIIEYISVGKKAKTLKGTILCLVGPPGVGKTSIGKSIAEALNRKFFRFSVGGMRDEAEIKGHRRTYIGAMPGKMIQALKTCQTMNPVIMLDEIDKLGSSYFGDPSSALLEALDPEQNSEFLDHYLDVRVDLSEVLFIVTANVLDSIPEPLLDRMEILRISGYILEEKIEIAKQYLIPKQKKAMGLEENEIHFTPSSLHNLIENYAREAGVRGLEKNIKKILRQITVSIVEEMERPKSKKEKQKSTDASKIQITAKTLLSYLGKPVFQSDKYYEKTPPGVVVGLAWTAMGGASLYVEAIKVHADKREMKITGHAGQVMKESSEIAWSYAQSALQRYLPNYAFFEQQQVHIHFPEGATPKDGPSAGITIITALFSLLLEIPVADNLAMTGEVTLTGQVLPIGGVKEKLVAAKRANITKVLLPKGNQRDFDELSPKIKENIEIVFVSHYDEVFQHAFPKVVSGALL